MTLRLIALLVIFMAGRPVLAQGTDQPPPDQTGGETPPTDTEPAKPHPIDAADIAPEAEELGARLREIAELVEPDQDSIGIQQQLDSTTREISRLTQDLSSSPPYSLRSVASARAHWSGLDDLLDGWEEALRDRLKALQLADDDLDSHIAVWQATGSDDDLPDNVLEQIDSVLSELNSARLAVQQRTEDVLTLQGRLSKRRVSTNKALVRLDDIEESHRSKLFVRDQPPLWRALASDGRDLAAEVSASVSLIEAALSEFATRYRAHVLVHAGAFVFLLIVIFMTRTVVSAGTMSEIEVERAAIVVRRPLSTALLISLLMLQIIYPIKSAEIVLLWRVVLLIPLLRLLPKLMQGFGPLLLALALVYVVEIAAQLAVDGSLLQRLMLLATSMLAILALSVALLRSLRLDHTGRRRVLALVRVLGWSGVFGLVGSVVANVVGMMALATLLATAMFNAIWVAIVFRVAFNVLSALFALILASSIARMLRSVRTHPKAIHHRTLRVIALIAILGWSYMVLGWLQLATPILRWCKAAIEHKWAIGTLEITLGGIASFIIAIAVAVIISKLLRFFLEEDVLGRLSLPRGAPATISTLVHYTIIGIGVVVALAASGMELSKLGFIIGALGVGIGFGLQDVVNNFVSGLILIFERPVKVGDLIELPNAMGHVTRIGARSSTVRKFDGSEVIIPNGNLISSAVTNWTGSDQRRRAQVLIPVTPGSDSRRVIEVLEAAARSTEGVVEDPAPFASFKSLDEKEMMFTLCAWPSIDSDWVKVTNELAAGALDALGEAGIDIPLPQLDVRLRQVEESE